MAGVVEEDQSADENAAFGKGQPRRTWRAVATASRTAWQGAGDSQAVG